MAKVAITEQYLTDIADAIRTKTGLSDLYYPAEMAPAILTISGSGGITPTGTINITTNGTHDVTRYASASVNVPTGSTILNQDKTVTPTESVQIIGYDSGYTGLEHVTVRAISSEYVGSGVTRNTSSDLSVSGASVSVPAGYYEEDVSTSVATTTHPNPTASINSTNGLVTASHTQSTGYVTGSTTTGTLQLTTQAAKTVTPSTSSQTAVAAGRYTTGAVTVAAVPTEEKTVTTNGEVTPSSGKFLSKVTVNVPTGSTINNQNKSVTPTESSQEVTADSGYTGLGTVTVGAISSTYVGSGIERRDSSSIDVDIYTERTPNECWVWIPSGYYADVAEYQVPNGTEGTPVATKGTVSNHNISIIPSVTNTQGFISGSTKTGTAVTVTASELVSGNKSITANGTNIDVTNYATVSVAVPTGSTISNQDKSVTPTESEQTVTADSGYTGLGTVTVSAISSTYVGSGITQRSSSDLSGATTSNPTAYTITAPAGYYSSSATFSLGRYDLVGPSISVNTTTGLITATSSIASNKGGYYQGGQTAPSTQQLTTQAAKTVTPTESEQTAVAANVYTTGIVKVGAISSTYIGSGISTRDSDDLTVSGATVTAPAGYYSAAASKSVATMTLPTAASASATSGYTSKATISRSTSAQYINIPPGYNNSGAYYVISATPNGSVTAPSSISGTAASVSTGTNTLTLTKTVSVTPSVTTAGYISSGTAGNSSVSLTANVTIDPTPTASGATVTIPAGYYTEQTTKSVTSGSATGPTSLSGSSATVTIGTNTITLTKTNVTTTPTVSAGYVSSATASTATVTLTASVTTKAAATITPSTTDQTIAAGTYLTGTQTIAGDTDLVGSNIISTANIFGTQGTVVIQKYYTGASAPSSSLGNNGDIYLQE